MATEPVPAIDVASLERENRRLLRAVQELSILNDLSKAIGGSLSTEQIMNTIINRSLRAVGAQQGSITLVRSTRQAAAETLVRGAASSVHGADLHLTESLLGWMHLNQKPLVVENPQDDERFQGIEWDPGLRNLLGVPVTVKGELRGILAIYNKKDGLPFDADDQRLLAIIAGQSAQVIENARLYEEEKALSHVREQLRLAGEVQKHLLPADVPEVEGYEFSGTSIAAQEIGGDSFDYFPMSNGRWGICLADVSGKGLPASLLMSNVQAIFRVLMMLDTQPGDALRLANRLLYRCTPPEKFVTLFLAVLDPSDGSLTFANAGHNPPLLVGEGEECARLSTKGIVLGLLDDFAYTQDRAIVREGGVLVIFSDGVSEALDATDGEFGEERL
ncbi:MAG TPA: PP2C family protein-serine/threonine phosphatase, partial [Thermoanaerobaculia bacterium]